MLVSVLCEVRVLVPGNRRHERRRLFARDAVEVSYLDGQPLRALARNDCLLEMQDPAGSVRVRAPGIDTYYENGLPARVVAGEGVTLEWPSQNGPGRSTSRSLEVLYREGRMTEAVQSGQFHYLQEDPQSRLELRSEEARYDPQSDRVTVHLIPTGTPYHPGLRGAFWTLAFSPAHTLVYSPHARGPGYVISEPAHVKGYTDLFATLQGVALSADDSLHHIPEIAARVPTPERRALHP